MNHTTRPQRPARLLLATALATALGAATRAPAAELRSDEAPAAAMVRWGGAPGGVCAIVGARDAALPLALARQGRFVVHVLCAERDRVGPLRQAIRAQGLTGIVSAHGPAGKRLPYASRLVNLLVVDGWPALAERGLTPAEVLRVLAPLGTAWVGTFAKGAEPQAWADPLAAGLRAAGAQDVALVEADGAWVRARKPWPPDIDEWTHYLHGADGNPVAQDREVGPPEHLQWTAGPTWLRSHETDSSVSTLVTARGRLFAIVDEAPISLAGQHPLPDQWFLVARDAFNGVLLWKVPIRRWGWREWKPMWFNLRPGDIPLNLQKRLVAAGDRVYVTLGYPAPVSQLDACTGAILHTYAGTERTNEILLRDGTLFLSILADSGLRVAVYDAESGARRWITDRLYQGSTTDYVKWGNRYCRYDPPELDPAANLATDGQVVALLDRTEIASLDARTGAELWRAPFPLDEADRRAGGIHADGTLWVGTMIVRDDVVLHASPHKLAAFAADTGKLLWAQPKHYIGHLWYEWKDVFVINGLAWTWSAEMDSGPLQRSTGRKQRSRWPTAANGYDLKTGKLAKQVPLGPIFKTHHHHRCYRNKATLRYILASRRGTEFVDLHGGTHTVHNWVRGTCHVGMMPANGLHYAPPHPCVCYIQEKLNGFLALAPKREEAPDAWDQEPGSVLERGPTYGKVPSSNSPAAGPEDWPTFRSDAARTGSVATDVPADAAVLWRAEVGRGLSAPTAVGGRLFVALPDQHQVVCLDAADGSRRWEFTAGGRVDSPPSYHGGAVLFGSADGWVYCVRAADGQLAWRVRAAPGDRLVAAHGQLESAWPVHGSVLVQDGTVYFAAGRSSHLDGGLVVLGLDAATGAVRHRTRLQGPHYTAENIEENYRLPMGALPDILLSDGERLFMRYEAFNTELKHAKGRPALHTRSGFLDDSYFKRAPWTFGGEYARLLVRDNRSAYFVRMFDTLRGLDPTVYFTPGQKGYLLFAKNVDGKRHAWTERVPVRIRAMVLAGGRLFVAGPPDVLDPDDPLGAFQGRKGGRLIVVDAASGEKLTERKLPSPPVFNGAAAARGRLVLVHEDGSVTCYGKRAP